MEQSSIEQSLLSLHQSGFDRDFRRNALFECLRIHLPDTGRCLDLGCGTGFMVKKLSEHGYDVVGIEPNASLVEVARNQLGEPKTTVTIQQGSVQNVGEFGAFDAILCLDTIEHIEDDLEALCYLAQACTTSSRLILTVPAMQCLFSRRDEELGHYRRYSRDQLLALFKTAGFQVLHCYYWNVLGVLPYWYWGKVLGKPIYDGLRTEDDRVLKRMIRRFLHAWLYLEGKCFFIPFGLTLICVASPSSDQP